MLNDVVHNLEKAGISYDVEIYNMRDGDNFKFERDILDHGYVQYVDGFGSDACIADAARVSYAQNSKKSSDEALINYLMKHKHTSPFEMCEVKFKIKMPIFIARQWFRHRTANVNEVSGRYSVLDNEYYNGGFFCSQSSTNKQKRGEPLDKKLQVELLKEYHDACEKAFSTYQILLRKGVSKEQARMVLPLSTYTTIIWKIDLHNLFNFIRLRATELAQPEIKDYAKALYDFCDVKFPIATSAFRKHIFEAKTLSLNEYTLIKRFTKGKPVERPENISDRDFNQIHSDFFS